MATQAEPVFFNPLDPEFRRDPYPQYHRLREADPVHRSPAGFVVLTRHEDVSLVVRDPRCSREVPRYATNPVVRTMLLTEEQALAPSIRALRDHSMLNLDPPDHDRLRRLVSKAFTPRAVEALRGHIQDVVDCLLARVRTQGRMDVIGDVAFPLPFTVISEMLGMPMDRREELRDWSQRMTRALEPFLTPEQVADAADASQRMMGHIASVVADRRRRPGDDMLSALIAAEERGDRLTDDELLATVALLYIAGHETTVNLVGNGLLALLRHPEELQRLRREPGLAGQAVEEALRYDSPVQFTGRVTIEPVSVGGQEVGAGEVVLAVLAAANRDPAVFDGPDRFEITRPDAGRHVSFGGGVHFCLGAALARAEAQVALGAIVGRLDDLDLDGEPTWRDTVTLRGLTHLPVRFAPAGA